MHPAVEIGQLEIGSLQRGERSAARRSSFAEIPCAVFVIMHHRLAEVTRERREVESAPAVANEFSRKRRRNRNAHIAQARTFGLQFPSACLGQVDFAEPEILALGLCAAYLRNAASIDDIGSHVAFLFLAILHHHSRKRGSVTFPIDRARRSGFRSCSAGLELEVKFPKPTQNEAGRVGEVILASSEADDWHSGQKSLERDSCLKPRQRGADAEMLALTEPEMSPRIGSAHIEPISVGKLGFVAISRGIHDCQPRSFGDLYAPDFAG